MTESDYLLRSSGLGHMCKLARQLAQFSSFCGCMREHQERTKHFFLISLVWLRGNAPKLAPGYIAQWLERLTADQQVPGSNPGVPSLLRARY